MSSRRVNDVGAGHHSHLGTSLNNPEHNDKIKRQSYSQICKKAIKLGLTANQVKSLPSYQQLVNLRDEESSSSHILFIIKIACFSVTFVCFVLSLTVSFLDFPVKHETAVFIYFDLVFGSYYVDELCLVPAPLPLRDVSRPPINCSVCEAVTHVDRVAGITPREFEERYAYSGRPVVITDAMRDWTAQHVLTFQYFKSLYAAESLVFTDSPDCQFFGYSSGFQNLSHAFQLGDSTAPDKPWYFGWSNCDSSVANHLRALYGRPYFLPEESESTKTDWIFMGSPGYGAPLHVDQVSHPSWQAQVAGTKLWTLEPPPECYHRCARELRVTLHPGDLIVVNTNAWFHSTLVQPGNISIAIGSEYD